MKKAIYIALLTLFAQSLFAQSNQVKATGVMYTDGPPTGTASEKSGSEFAIDTVSGFIYQWHRTPGPSVLGGWRVLGQGIDVRVDLVAPTYTPFRNQSAFVVNAAHNLYHYYAGSWYLIGGGGGGGGGTVVTDATLSGDGSGGTPLKVAQQSAASSEVLTWTGATWEPSWGNPFIFVTTGSTITTAVNEILIGTVAANVTMGLPTCDATTDGKHFKFVRNGADAFSVTIDPSGSQTFYDGTSTKLSYGKLSIDCTCRFSGGTGVWFFDNF